MPGMGGVRFPKEARKQVRKIINAFFFPVREEDEQHLRLVENTVI